MAFFTGEPGRPLDFSLELRDDGRFGLAERFGYRDPTTGAMFIVPRRLDEFSTDGASVPVGLSWLIPRFGAELPASVLHDALVLRRKRRLEHLGPNVPRSEADRIFLTALEELRVPVVRRYLMWTGVRLGEMGSGAWSRLLLILAGTVAVLWPIAVLFSLTTGGERLAIWTAAGVTVVALLGIVLGGDVVRPLALLVFPGPLLIPTALVVSLSYLAYLLVERGARSFKGTISSIPKQQMAIDTKPPPTPVDGLVFVSYARENRNDVEPWRESLATATRANVWWDNDITPGERWRSEILDRLSDASCVVLFWSRHAKESDFINEVEVPEALKRDILVLATIDDAPLTEELGEMQAAVLHNDETGNEWDKLTGAISDMLTSGSTGATQSPA